MTTTKARTAAIYCRISRDIAGRGLGVQRQEEECRALCERRGWKVSFVATDNDVSAYSGAPRPGFRRVLDAVTADQVDAVVAWHPDRITRRPAELEDIITLVEAHRVEVATVAAGDYDLSTASGRMVARVVGATARAESERTAERLRSMHAQKAKSGEPVGRRAFGWTTDGKLDRKQAALIRSAADRIIEGAATWKSVADEWTAKGIPTAQGASAWSSTAVKKILTNPRIAGHRVHRGEVVGRGTWTPILDDATWAQLVARAKVASTGPGHPRRRVGLTGLMICGACGSPMHRNSVNGRAHWICSECRGVSITADYTERLIAETVAAVLPEMDFGSADDSTAQREALGREMETLAGMLASGDLSAAAYSAAAAAVGAKIEELSEQEATSGAMVGLEKLSADELLDLPHDVQRAVYTTVIEWVTIAPSRRGVRWNPDRVSITWRS